MAPASRLCGRPVRSSTIRFVSRCCSQSETGPTIVGDSTSSPALMEFLDARRVCQLGNNFVEYRSELPPRDVLNKLETAGYHVVAMSGIGQTCIWTLYKKA